MDWMTISGITTKEERDSVAMALFHAGYEVRQVKRKEGGLTMIDIVIDVEYRRRFDGQS